MGAFDSSPSALTPGKPDWSPIGDEAGKAPKAKPAEPAPEAKPETPATKPGSDLFSGIGKGGAAAQQHIAALEAEKMKLNPPQIGLPPKPEPKHTSPVEQWGSFAMLFAALGGMMSRNHMTTALNAASSVMNAFKENDTKKAEESFKQWESSNKTAIQLYEFQQRAYEQALGRIDKSENLALKQGGENDKAAAAKINALLHAFGDAPGIAAYQHGGLPEFEAYKKKQADALEKLKEHSDELKDKTGENIARRLITESPTYKEASPDVQIDMLLKNHQRFSPPKEPAAKSASGEEAVSTKVLMETEKFKTASPEDKQKMLLENFRAYHQPKASSAPVPKDLQEPPSPAVAAMMAKLENFDMNPKMTKAEIQGNPEQYEAVRRMKLDPSWHETDFAYVQNFKAAMEKGAGPGAQLKNLDSVRHHIDYLRTLAEKLPSASNVMQANALARAISKQFGEQEVSTFEAAKSIVGPEIIKAIVGASGGGVEERKDAVMNLFSTAYDHQQMEGAAHAVKVLLGAQAAGIMDDQFKAVPLRVAERFVNTDMVKQYRQELKDAEHGDSTFWDSLKKKDGHAPKPEGAPKVEGVAPKPEGAKPVEITDEASARKVLEMPDDAQVTVNGKTGPVSAIREQLKKKLGL